jgi:hypothetical protein
VLLRLSHRVRTRGPGPVDPGTPVRPAWLDIWHNAPGFQNVPGSPEKETAAGALRLLHHC